MAINSSITSPADAINNALARIGYKLRVGNLYDGSAASKVALTIYSQTRDWLLRADAEGMTDWGFAERNVSLTLLKSAPAGGYVPPVVWTSAYPPLPWLFEYTYPSDCLKVRAVKPQTIFTIDFDPQPWVYAVENDNAYSPTQKVILSNVAGAILTYTGQITDPLTWEPDFAEALCAALATRLAPSLGNLDVAKLEAQDQQGEIALASEQRG